MKNVRLAAFALLATGCQTLFPLESSDAGGQDSVPSDPPRFVFVTSESFQGSTIGGLEGADAHCVRLANAAGLDGEFRAWLSVDDQSPESRMVQGNGPYMLVGDTPIADRWEDLVDGGLKNAIQLDELGRASLESASCEVDSFVGVWSNTMASGAGATVDSCGGWTSSTGLGTIGNASSKDETWSLRAACTFACSFFFPFYCVQQ